MSSENDTSITHGFPATRAQIALARAQLIRNKETMAPGELALARAQYVRVTKKMLFARYTLDRARLARGVEKDFGGATQPPEAMDIAALSAEKIASFSSVSDLIDFLRATDGLKFILVGWSEPTGPVELCELEPNVVEVMDLVHCHLHGCGLIDGFRPHAEKQQVGQSVDEDARTRVISVGNALSEVCGQENLALVLVWQFEGDSEARVHSIDVDRERALKRVAEAFGNLIVATLWPGGEPPAFFF